MNLHDHDEEPVLTDPPVGVTPITADKARVLVDQFQRTAVIPPAPVKGILLDRLQVAATQLLLNADDRLKGVRVYLGREGDGRIVGVVMGVDENDHDLTTGTIYQTESPGTGICPPICDRESPINRD
jgi:hypothetical protein